MLRLHFITRIAAVTFVLCVSRRIQGKSIDQDIYIGLVKTFETCHLSKTSAIEPEKYKNHVISTPLSDQESIAVNTFLNQMFKNTVSEMCSGPKNESNRHRKLEDSYLKATKITPCIASMGLSSSILFECFGVAAMMDFVTAEKVVPAFTYACLDMNLGYAVTASIFGCLMGNSKSISTDRLTIAGGNPDKDPPPPGSGYAPQCESGEDKLDIGHDIQDLNDPNNPSGNDTTISLNVSAPRRRLQIKLPAKKYDYNFNGKECSFGRKSNDIKWKSLGQDMFNPAEFGKKFENPKTFKVYENNRSNSYRLPAAEKLGYREVDVYPAGLGLAKNLGRGQYRVVKNMDTGDMYFTQDHYKSFFKLRAGSSDSFILSKIS